MRALYGDLTAALGAADSVAVDCGGIERADLSFVQLLVSARRTARRDGKTLSATNLSQPARSAFARAGLSAADPLHDVR